MIVQCRLKQAETIMVSWVEAKVCVGNYITLMGLDGVWEVLSCSSPRLASDIKAQNDRTHKGVFGSII